MQLAERGQIDANSSLAWIAAETASRATATKSSAAKNPAASVVSR